MKRHLLIPALVLALAACNKPPQDTPTPPAVSAPAQTPAVASTAPPLSAYHWRLTEAQSAQGKRIDALFISMDKPLQLDFVDGRLSVGNTCNRMGGSDRKSVV